MNTILQSLWSRNSEAQLDSGSGALMRLHWRSHLRLWSSEGWEICCQVHSLTWLLVGGLSSSSGEPLHKVTQVSSWHCSLLPPKAHDRSARQKSKPNSLSSLNESGTQSLPNSASFHCVLVFCIAVSQEISCLIRSFFLHGSVLAKQERNFYGQLV